ncbi:hypothetical protein ABZ504_04995, partial [Streptomyces mirabilis]|uniref:hypothetical protein n=1 Tax=Streptomyces mirabilis TaxID=68239 RepID=UPI0033F78A28
WDRLDDSVRGRVVDWLSGFIGARVNDSNWRLRGCCSAPRTPGDRGFQGRGELRDQPPPARGRRTTGQTGIRGAAPAQGRGELRGQPPPARGRGVTPG